MPAGPPKPEVNTADKTTIESRNIRLEKIDSSDDLPDICVTNSGLTGLTIDTTPVSSPAIVSLQKMPSVTLGQPPSVEKESSAAVLADISALASKARAEAKASGNPLILPAEYAQMFGMSPGFPDAPRQDPFAKNRKIKGYNVVE